MGKRKGFNQSKTILMKNKINLNSIDSVNNITETYFPLAFLYCE